jgi:TolB protein
MRLLATLTLNLALLLAAAAAHAELTIEITQGMDNPTAVAVVPFAFNSPGIAPEDIARVVHDDLNRSG